MIQQKQKIQRNLKVKKHLNFLFLLYYPLLFYVIFRFQLVVSSSLISSVISVTKILLGVPLFSLLFLVYARIRISTIEVDTNTHQVLAVSARTGKPL